MNIFLWTLQVLLALHTVIGAGWKVFNSKQTIPSLKLLPHGFWTAASPFELICAVGLIVPLITPSTGILVPLASTGIAVEMLLFSGVHLQSGAGLDGTLSYWLGMVLVCAVIAVGRLMISPL